MAKYVAEVYMPVVYEINAKSGEEAREKALALYQKQHNTWVEPQIDVRRTTGRWLLPKLYKSEVDEEDLS